MKRINYIVFYFLLLWFSGCLKDNPIEIPKFRIENSTAAIIYLQNNGDYINSPESPSLISVDDVYNNLGSYLVIDVRNSENYLSGHIIGSVNIHNDSLFQFVQNIYPDYPRIVLVSQTGQSSAYYTCLLQLAGFSNVFSMNFGMSYWNRNFSSKWINSLGDFVNEIPFNDVINPKHAITQYPTLNLNTRESFAQSINERIQLLLQEGFPEDSVEANQPYETYSLITAEKLKNYYGDGVLLSDEIYLICYGKLFDYVSNTWQDPLPGLGHPNGAILYDPEIDFRSAVNLQSLPITKKIFIYDNNGQSSPFITAYLKLLGYNAKAVLFGNNHLIYTRLVNKDFDTAFLPENIRNYAYE